MSEGGWGHEWRPCEDPMWHHMVTQQTKRPEERTVDGFSQSAPAQVSRMDQSSCFSQMRLRNNRQWLGSGWRNSQNPFRLHSATGMGAVQIVGNQLDWLG